MFEEDMYAFKKMFSDYCRSEFAQGHCKEYDCEFCCVNRAWERIFESDYEELEEEEC